MQHSLPYSTYWKAWFALLLITLGMVYLKTPAVLIVGMLAKAAIITLWFMHLKYERRDMAIVIIVAVFATTLLLFGLIVPDGLAM